MWALADMVKHFERVRWERLFGVEFTGFSEGRRVSLQWREQVTGHVCMGNVEQYGHLRCQQLVTMRWVFVRQKAEAL